MRKVLGIITAVALGAAGLFAGGSVAKAHTGHVFTISDSFPATEGQLISFQVSLNLAPQSGSQHTESIKVDYATAQSGTADGQDYLNKQGTLTFGPGVTAQRIDIPSAQDTQPEPNETFSVVLSNARGTCVRTAFPGGPCATGAGISDGVGIGTITDDDTVATPSAPPTTPPTTQGLAISDSAPATKATDCVHTVTLGQAALAPVTVQYAASGAVAQLGTPTNGTVSFAAGETSKQIRLDVIKQRRKPGTVTVTLSGATGATIGDGTGTCVISKKKKHHH